MGTNDRFMKWVLVVDPLLSKHRNGAGATSESVPRNGSYLLDKNVVWAYLYLIRAALGIVILYRVGSWRRLLRQ